MRFFSLTLKVTVTLISVLALGTILARNQIISFYTEDEELIAMAGPLLILIGCNYLGDGMQGYLQGPIRAMGLQKIAAYMTLACFWPIGIPVSATLAFAYDFGVTGLLTGLLAATALQCLSYLAILIRTNWQDIAD